MYREYRIEHILYRVGKYQRRTCIGPVLPKSRNKMF